MQDVNVHFSDFIFIFIFFQTNKRAYTHTHTPRDANPMLFLPTLPPRAASTCCQHMLSTLKRNNIQGSKLTYLSNLKPIHISTLITDRPTHKPTLKCRQAALGDSSTFLTTTPGSTSLNFKSTWWSFPTIESEMTPVPPVFQTHQDPCELIRPCNFI